MEGIEKRIDLTKPGFHSAQLKLSRARELIDQLIKDIDLLAEVLAPRIETIWSAEHNDYTSVFIVPKIPVDFCLITGDIFHNLRSCLDHIASGIYYSVAGELNSRIHFPFHEKREQFRRTASKHEIYRIAPAVWKRIELDIRPYSDEDGDFVLWCITKFNNIDKHRLIVLSAMMGQVCFDAHSPSRNAFIRNCTVRLLGAGSYVLTVGQDMTPQNLVFQSRVYIFEDELLEPYDLIALLKKAYNSAFSALNILEEEFLSVAMPTK